MEALLVWSATMFFIIGCAWVDFDHILDGNTINHNSRTFQRGAFFFLIALYNFQFAAASVLLFMAAFDAMINYLMDKPLFFLGTTAKWDIFWSKWKKSYIAMKIITLTASILLYKLKF